MKVAIIGAGGWGTALAKLLALKGHRIRIWSRSKKVCESLKRGENPYYLPGVSIPTTIEPSTDISFVIEDAELVVFAVPAQAMREVLLRAKEANLGRHIPVLNVAKGIEIDTCKRMEEVFRETIGEGNPYATLSGPSHAEEVARDVPTSVVVASRDLPLAREIQRNFSTITFRVYTNDDVIGVELAGALKNIIAIAAGVIDGMGGWDNSKAALVTRGLAEMIRFAVPFGARKETFMGLAGIGDLVVTCISRHSRNRYVGEMIGRGKKLEEILAEMRMVAEGVYTVKPVYRKAREMGIEMPITEKVYQVLYEGKDPRTAIHELMSRELKPEVI